MMILSCINGIIVSHHYRILLCWIEEFFIAHRFNKNNTCAYVLFIAINNFGWKHFLFLVLVLVIRILI